VSIDEIKSALDTYFTQDNRTVGILVDTRDAKK
jgi:hypothetical protein